MYTTKSSYCYELLTLSQDMCTFVDTYHTPHRTFLGTHATGYVQCLYVGMMPDLFLLSPLWF